MEQVLVMIEALYLPIFIRALGAATFLPFGEGGGGQVRRLGFAIVIAITLGGEPSGMGTDLIGCCAQFFVGALISLPIALVISAAEMWGALFDAGRGQSIGQMYDPFHESQGDAFGILSQWTVIAVLFQSGALISVVKLLSQSGGILGNGDDVVAERLFYFINLVITHTFVVALWFLGLSLLVEVSSGIISKFVPGVSLSSEAFIAKTLVGILLATAILSGEPFVELAEISESLSHVLIKGA